MANSGVIFDFNGKARRIQMYPEVKLQNTPTLKYALTQLFVIAYVILGVGYRDQILKNIFKFQLPVFFSIPYSITSIKTSNLTFISEIKNLLTFL